MYLLAQPENKINLYKIYIKRSEHQKKHQIKKAQQQQHDKCKKGNNSNNIDN